MSRRLWVRDFFIGSALFGMLCLIMTVHWGIKRKKSFFFGGEFTLILMQFFVRCFNSIDFISLNFFICMVGIPNYFFAISKFFFFSFSSFFFIDPLSFVCGKFKISDFRISGCDCILA